MSVRGLICIYLGGWKVSGNDFTVCICFVWGENASVTNLSAALWLLWAREQKHLRLQKFLLPSGDAAVPPSPPPPTQMHSITNEWLRSLKAYVPLAHRWSDALKVGHKHQKGENFHIYNHNEGQTRKKVSVFWNVASLWDTEVLLL